MDDQRFRDVSEQGLRMLSALMSPMAGALGGEVCTYNAYLGDLEVVVVAYQRDHGNETLTRPVAILVDDAVFAALETDDEVGRLGPDGQPIPPKTRERR